MGEYLKMSDVFELKELQFPKSWSYKMVKHAAHAINSHDELVENMHHYKQEAERWEARATNEASRVQDLVVEVERLRGKLQDAHLDGCHAGWDMSCEGYNAEYGGPDDGAMHDMFVTKSIEYMK